MSGMKHSVYQVQQGSSLAGLLTPWNARLGSLDAATGSFTDRKESHAAAGPSGQGFCGILGSGQVLVGTPGMSAICRRLAQQPGIEGQWGAKVLLSRPSGITSSTVVFATVCLASAIFSISPHRFLVTEL